MTRRIAAIGGLGALAIAVTLALGVWYFLFRDNAPPSVDLESAVASAVSTTATSGTAGISATVAPTSSPALAGTWRIVAGGPSFVGYRVREQLATVGASTAVGRTNAVTGSLAFDGSKITGVAIEANLSRLQSDRSQRDGALRQQALETNRFPTATFKLTQPIQLTGVPEPDKPVEATAAGDLTIHGVTKSVSIPLQGQLTNRQVVVVGSLDILFADYGIAQPRAVSVLSVEDHGVIELQLIFLRE